MASSAVQLPGGAGHPGGLVALVLGVVAHDAFAVAGIGPQRLRLAFDVVVDHRVGGVEDGLRTAVVLVEDHRRDVGERLLEVDDVAEVGATESVHAVVDQHAVGVVGVGDVDLEVVDGAVVRHEAHRVDRRRHPPVAITDQHLHPGMDVGDRHQVVDRAVMCESSAYVESADRGHPLGIGKRLPIVLPAGLVTQRLVLARSHVRHPPSAERLRRCRLGSTTTAPGGTRPSIGGRRTS